MHFQMKNTEKKPTKVRIKTGLLSPFFVGFLSLYGLSYQKLDINLITSLNGLILLFNTLASVTTIWFLYLICLDLGASVKRAIVIAMSMGLSTAVWPYAVAQGTLSLTALGIVGALRMVIRYRRDPSVFRALSASLFVSLAMLGHTDSASSALIISVWWLIQWTAHVSKSIRSQRKTIESSGHHTPPHLTMIRVTQTHIVELISYICPLLMLILFLIYEQKDQLSYPLDGDLVSYFFDYYMSTQLWTRLIDGLLHPNRGLLIFCPILLICAYGTPQLWRKYRGVSVVTSLIIVTHLVFYTPSLSAQSKMWGPLFLVTLVAPFTITLATLDLTKKHVKSLWYTFACWGFLIQLICVCTPLNQDESLIILQFDVYQYLVALKQCDLAMRLDSLRAGYVQIWWLSTHWFVSVPLWVALLWSGSLIYRRVKLLSRYIRICETESRSRSSR